MSHQSHFVPPVKFYVGTLLSLLVLTFVTVYAAQFDFGSWNLIVAMFIACVKAALVALFFMGLKWEGGFNRVIFVSTLLFLFIFFAFTLVDLETRGDIDSNESEIHGIKSPVRPIGKGTEHHETH